MKEKILILVISVFTLIACSDETKVQSIKLNPTEKTLNIGESFHIEMLIDPISAIIYNPVSWKSSNPNVARVDDKGKVTAIYAGECIITGKTKTEEAYCKVIVVAPKSDISFSKAIIFDEGVNSESSQRNMILRLYNDDLTIDSTGLIIGNGVFLNINLYIPNNNHQIVDGIYTMSDTISDFSILPGSIVQEGNNYYAKGSYLGQYTDNGLSALFLKKGEINISKSSTYTIFCQFEGAQTEKIEATFCGNIPHYNTSAKNEIKKIKYTNVDISSIDINEEPTVNHQQIIFSTNDTSISFIARVPLSIKGLPQGSYHTNSEIKAYTLIPEKSNITIQDKTNCISSAILHVKGNDYYATFKDSDGINYHLESAQNKENIQKQKLKTFVFSKDYL